MPNSGGSEDRPLVYLLHGLLTTAQHHFAPQIRAWSGAVVSIPLDLPGHGRCPLDAMSLYVRGAVEYALTVMRRFGSGHVVAASYLGCPVAVHCALERPDLVESLVLTGFAPGVPHSVFVRWFESFATLADQNAALRTWYDDMHGPRWRDTLDAYGDDVELRYEDVLVDEKMLAALTTPTLLANGSEKSNERDAALRATTLGPRFCGRVIDGAGHAPGRDRTEEFNDAVQSFWTEVGDAAFAGR